MTITKDDATHALGEIDAARGRARQMRGYSRAAPFLILWGAIWMVCDLTSQFEPRWWPAWPIGAVAGTIASTMLGFSLPKEAPEHGEPAGGWRHMASWLLVFAFIVSLFLVIPVTSNREIHSVFGLVFGFIYVGVGIWGGWRIIALGAALIALTLVGFFAIGQWYALYMGLVSGGALILGGLWLRKI
jgi:hypothetical protein